MHKSKLSSIMFENTNVNVNNENSSKFKYIHRKLNTI